MGEGEHRSGLDREDRRPPIRFSNSAGWDWGSSSPALASAGRRDLSVKRYRAQAPSAGWDKVKGLSMPEATSHCPMSHSSPVVCFSSFANCFPLKKPTNQGCPDVGKMTTAGIRFSSLTPRAHSASRPPQSFPHGHVHGFRIAGLLLRSHQGSVAVPTSQPRPEVRGKGVTAAGLTRLHSPNAASHSSAPSGMGLLTTCLGNPSPLLSSLLLESTCS